MRGRIARLLRRVIVPITTTTYDSLHQSLDSALIPNHKLPMSDRFSACNLLIFSPNLPSVSFLDTFTLGGKSSNFCFLCRYFYTMPGFFSKYCLFDSTTIVLLFFFSMDSYSSSDIVILQFFQSFERGHFYWTDFILSPMKNLIWPSFN